MGTVAAQCLLLVLSCSFVGPTVKLSHSELHI